MTDVVTTVYMETISISIKSNIPSGPVSWATYRRSDPETPWKFVTGNDGGNKYEWPLEIPTKKMMLVTMGQDPRLHK